MVSIGPSNGTSDQGVPWDFFLGYSGKRSVFGCRDYNLSFLKSLGE